MKKLISGVLAFSMLISASACSNATSSSSSSAASSTSSAETSASSSSTQASAESSSASTDSSVTLRALPGGETMCEILKPQRLSKCT